MRETSRIVILPLNEESGIIDDKLDAAMDAAGGVIGKLVSLREELRGNRMKRRVSVLTEKLVDILPSVDATRRLATNYAMLLGITEVVNISMLIAEILSTNLNFCLPQLRVAMKNDNILRYV